MSAPDRTPPSSPRRRGRAAAAGAPRPRIVAPPSPLKQPHVSRGLTAGLLALTLAALAAPLLAHLYVVWSSRDLRAPARGANLVLNSGFETSDGAEGAAYWFAGGSGMVVRDPAESETGRFALRMSSADGGTVIAETFLARVPLSDRVHIECQARARGLRGRAFARMAFYAPDGSGPIAEPQTSSLTGTSDWKILRSVARVPAGAGSAMVQLVVEGRGTVWFDNVRAIAEEAWDPGAGRPPSPPGPFQNGSFENLTAAGLPQRWVLAEGAVVDASVSRTGECSLRAAPRQREGLSAVAQQDYALPAGAGSRTAAQVYVSSPSGADVCLRISCFDRQGRLMAEHSDAGKAEGGEWPRLFVDFTLPDGCAFLRMTLSAQGGECWFDDAAVR